MENSMAIPRIAEIELPYDPEIPALKYPIEIKTYVHTKPVHKCS